MKQKFSTTAKALFLALLTSITLAACTPDFEASAKGNKGDYSSAKCNVNKRIAFFKDKADSDLKKHQEAKNNDKFYDNEVTFTYADGSLNKKDYQNAIDKGRLVPCHVFKVYDGDTATCTLNNGEKTRIRFLGIDAPEAKQYQGKEAGNWLRKQLLNRKVYIDPNNRDIYKRVLSTVYVDGRNINYELVRRGYVFTYNKNRQSDKYTALYAVAFLKAIEEKVGMWSSDVNTCHIIDPYDYRRR